MIIEVEMCLKGREHDIWVETVKGCKSIKEAIAEAKKRMISYEVNKGKSVRDVVILKTQAQETM